jgi:two-component system response regulator RegA
MSAQDHGPGAGPRCRRLLIVVSERDLCSAIDRATRERADESRRAVSVAEAVPLIASWWPDAVVLDCDLPDGCGFDVLQAVGGAVPSPAVVAIGSRVAPEDSFRLAQLGVRAFVAKPATASALARALDEALATTPDLEPLARAAVGHRGVREVEDLVRAAMVAEALARANGSRHAAARLLAISRQLLQHILKKQQKWT